MNENYATGGQAANRNHRILGPDAPPSPRPIAEAMDRLQRAADQLHKAISEHQDRLNPVLGPPMPEGVGTNAKEARDTLAAQILRQASAIESASLWIDSLTSRLEL